MATAPTRQRGPRADPPHGEQRTLLRGLGWDGYQALLEWFGDDAPRMTCARGNVEIMSPLPSHGHFDAILGLMIELVAGWLEIPHEPFTPITLRRSDQRIGIEPDRSYYFANVDRLGGRRDIDLDAIPPPDLCVEVEMTHSLLPKMPLYAALGVPEVWRFDGQRLTVFLLDGNGEYQPGDRSLALPGVPMAEFERFLLDYRVGDGVAWRRRFHAWVRDTLGPIVRPRDLEG